jgi:tRNA(fMet)-specific endonuclease VapC
VTGQIGADTSLLIDFFKGKENAVDFVRKNAGVLVVAELVVYEFLCGNFTDKEQNVFLGAMQSFPTSNTDRNAVLLASRIFRSAKRSGTPVGHQDALIAASYLAVGIRQIATKNTKHFRNISELKVLEYA